MKKITLLITFIFAFSWLGNAQVLVSEDFDSGTPAGWTDSYANTSTVACSGNSERDNLWSFSSTGDLTSPNYAAGSNGTDLTVSFDYKIVEYDSSNPIVPQGPGWGTAELQYSTDDGANWTTILTIDDGNHTASADCTNISAVIPAADLPDGSDVKLRVSNTWASGDYYFYIDNFEANQQISCVLPVATTTVVEDCANSEYSVEVDVTDLGDATELTLTNDIGLPAQSITSTGVVTFGPVASGQAVVLELTHDTDSDCDLSLGSVSFTCPPVNDNCEGALPLSVTTDNTTFTAFATDFATGSALEQVSCDDIGTNLGVWYTFTAPSEQLEFLQGSDGDPGIAIFEGPDCSNLTEITTGCTNNDDGTITGLTVGNDYYAMVFTDSSQDLANFVLYYIECPAPTNLTVSNITTSSADLSWTAGDAETEWEVLWGPAGFDPSTEGTLVSDDDGTLGVTLSGLTENTPYDYYVKSICSSSSSSDFEGPFAFTTSCEAFVAPFNEDFSSLALPNCWSQGAANQKDWEFDDSTSGTNIGDDGTVNSTSASGGGFAWLDDSSPHELDTRLESPFIDVSGLTVPALSFYYISNNQGDLNVDFRVEVWDGAAWNQVFFSNQNTPNGEWSETFVDLSTLTITGNIKLAFIIDENSETDFNDDIALDDVTVDELPSCISPAGLTASNIGLNSADISWDNVSTATDGYIWSLYLAGADPDVDSPEDSGTTAAGIETVSFNALVEGTDYEFYVESDCGADGTSGLSAALAFSTLTPGLDCSTPITATVAPAGDTTQPIIFDTTDVPDMSSVPSCEGFDSTEQGFWYEFTTNATDGVALNLLLGDAGDLEGAVYDACGGTELLCFADGGSVDFSSEVLVTGLMPNTTYILQVYTETFSEGAFELAITDLPACTQPVNLSASNLLSDSATLNWDDVANATNGFQWIVYTSPSDPSVDTEAASGTVGAGVTTADVIGLMPATDYDFYVLSDCDADGLSSLAGPATFTTACAPFPLNFEEDFTGLTTNVNTSLNCWEEGSGIFTPVGSSGWGGQTFNNDSSNDNGNGQALYINLYSSSPTNAFVSTPIIDLGAGDPSYVLNYDVFVKPWTGNDQVTDMGPHSVSVVISTDGGVTWDLAANTLTTYDTSNIPNDLSNTLESISLDGYSGQIKIGFLSDEDGTAFDFRFYIDNLYVGPPPPPANDNLCDAIPLTVGAPSSGDAFTNVSATAEASEPVAACFNAGINGSVWFTFEAPDSGDVTVTTDIVGGTLNDTEVAVYDAPGDCADMTTFATELACSQDIGFPNFLSELEISGLTPGATYYVQVDQWGTATPGTFGIRVLDNNPPCPEPANLNVTGITSDSATLNWDDDVLATLGYSWSVFASPSDPAADTAVASGTTGAGVSTANVSGLMPQTDYDFYVFSDCDANGQSILAGPVTFTTDCGPAALNYEEDFTNLNFDLNDGFDCWNEGTGVFAVTEGSGWGPQTFNNDAANDNGNGQSLYVNLYNSGGQVNNWATTQSIDLGSGDPGYVLSYDAFVKPWSGNDQVTDMGLHNVTVVVSTDGGSTWDLASNTLTVYDNSNIPNDLTDTKEEFSLASYSGVIKIGFLTSEEGIDTDLSFYIDNVFVGTPPVCNEPTILNVTNVTFDSAQLNWTGVPEATNGYEWSVYAAPSDPSTDTPVASGTVGAGVEMAMVSGLLMPETDYDFYVSSDCDADGLSDLAGPETFTTPPAPVTVDCSTGTPENVTVCYDNNENLIYPFTSNDGSQLRVTFIEGYFEDCCDDIIVYDGLSTTDPILFQSDTNFNNDATGIEATSTGDSILVQIVSDGSVSCAAGSGSPALNFDVSCVPTDELDYYNVQFPSNGTIALGDSFTVFAQAYEAGLTDASDTPAAGIEAWIGYSTVDSNPNTIGDWTWVPATPNPGFDFTQNNDEYQLDLGAVVGDVGTFYYASRWRLNGGPFTYGGILPDGSNGGQWGTNGFVSGVLTVNAPVGDSCSDPLVVGALPFSDTNDTANFTDFYDGSPGANCGSTASYLGGNDVVYSYTATFDGEINAELIGADNYTGVFMYNDCADIGTACAEGGVNGFSGGDIFLDNIPVTNGSTYIFVISTWPSPQDTPYTFNINESCSADAGTLLADATPVILSGGVATISATEDVAPTVPAGYQTLYVLTSGSGLVIEQTNSTPTFDVNATGDYTIHTLVYDPATLDLSTITPGVTTGFDVNGLLIQGGGTICGALDVTGAPISVQNGASAQIIHNSADPAAEFVDVYIDGSLQLPNLQFRTATPYLQFLSDTPALIEITPAGSSTVVYSTTVTLTEGETYAIIASGVLDPTQFDSSVNTVDFNIEIFAGAQQTSTNPGETSLLIHHGATDAPAVDAIEISVPAGPLAQDIAYPQFQGYVDVPTSDYLVNVETADNTGLVATYSAPLATLGTNDLALTVLASGFLNPAANQNGAAFGLWAALPTGGALVELPVVEPAVAAPDPVEDPANVISLFSGVYTDVTVDTFLTPWSNAQLNDVQVQGNDVKRYHALDFAGIETVANPIDASGMDFFHIDVWSPNATTFRVKLVDLAAGVEGELAFNIAQQQWVSLEIPLEDFADPALVTDPNNLLTSTSSIQQLIISGLPVGAVTAYVDNMYFSDDPNVSTVDFDSENFSFYPNPTRGVLNIQSSNQIEEIKVFSILGQEVLRLTPNAVSPSINVDALQAGTYLMNVTIDGVTKNFKFIKE